MESEKGKAAKVGAGQIPVIPRPGDSKWIQTASGGQFFPLKPRPEDLRIIDIAHALAHTCRFTGHCVAFYSVAQHCTGMVSMLRQEGADMDTLRAALLHDVDEAYLPDVPRPIKPYLYFSLPPTLPIVGDREGEPRLVPWSEVGDAIADMVALRYKLPIGFQRWTKVTRADLRMLATERRDIMATPPAPWVVLDGVEPYAETIEPFPPRVARRLFIDHFATLFKEERVPQHFNAIGGNPAQRNLLP